jgi:hypothetical protein
MKSGNTAKKNDADSFNDVWAKQWSDTTEERAKKQAAGKVQYDAIIERKKRSDEDPA